MPHCRNRFAIRNILKKLSYFRVVGINGPRQCGKSYLVRELLTPHCPQLVYRSFDQPTLFEFATANPETFLSQHQEAAPLVIDEAQKIPKIFDAVKYVVDQKQSPGQFLLLGSTEFSKKALIRESLTGRIGLVKLFPMTCRETQQIAPSSDFPFSSKPKITRSQFMKYLSHGGMPAICFIRSEIEREDQVKAWLETTVYRDLALVPRLKLNPDLAMSILRTIATLEEPHAGNIAKAVKRDPRVVNTHLSALEMLFVLQKIGPHSLGTGKPIYFMCDVGFATYLGANFERQLHTMALQEITAKNEFHSGGAAQISFYRTSKGSFVHFIIEAKNTLPIAIKLLFSEKIDQREIEILRALSKKAPKPKMKLIALGPTMENLSLDGVEILPWESIC